MKDKRKVFFTGLLIALLIISTIVDAKMTVVANLPLPCSVFVYPFTFLCVAVITHLYGAKEAMKSVAYALSIQVLLYVVSIIVINLPNQVDTLMEANALQAILAPSVTNEFYHPNIMLMFGTILAFGVSQLINIGLYAFSSKYTFKIVSSALSILFAFVVNTVLFNLFKSLAVPTNNLMLTVLNQFIVGVIATVISVILFSIFTIGKKEDTKKSTSK